MAPVTVGISIDVSEKRYAGRRPIIALRNLETRIAPGEFCVVTGPSGCGKTTLLNIVAGLDKDFLGVLGFEPAGGRLPRIGYVFQNPRLLPWRTVRENVALVRPRDHDRFELERLLGEVGLVDAADVYPTRLSGGMARRAALARAFAITPDLLLMDEPFVSLDGPAADRLPDRVLVLSPAPGRILAEMPIPLPRERRHDGDTLAALQAELARLAGIHPGRSSLRIPSS